MNLPRKKKKATYPAQVNWAQDMLVLPKFNRVYESGVCSHFSDDLWDLRYVSGKVTVSINTLSFREYPSSFRDTAKRIAWCMLNIKAPIELLDRPNAARSRLAVGTVAGIMGVEIKPFLKWADQQEISALCEITDDLLRLYGEDIAKHAVDRNRKARLLWGPSRFWLYASYLPSADRLSQPPWEREGASDILGPAHWSGENKTSPIHPQTMSPLLLWSTKIINEMSGSILEAIQEKESLLSRLHKEFSDDDKDRLVQYLDYLEARDKGIPGFIGPLGLVLGSRYVATMVNVGLNGVRRLVNKKIQKGIQIKLGCPLKTKPSLTINNIQVLESYDFYKVDDYRRLVATACLVVIAYLSGMRSEECRGLTRGCCKKVLNADGTHRYEIWARSYKDALDANGNAIIGGAVREQPWHVIAPVAKAIHLMETIHNQEYLFSKGPLRPLARENKGLALETKEIASQIDNLIKWCNKMSKHANAPNLYIPEDPDGPITMGRFRRTLAWFIFRRPGGRISLGIQYGHLRGLTSDGYGSRASKGLRDIFPMEEAFARAAALEAGANRLSQGEGVSGPSAERYISGLKVFASEYAGKYLTTRQFAQLRRNPALRIFDNGIQPVACCYDVTQALCHPDRERKNEAIATPDLTRCDSHCPNVARTDSHISDLRNQILWENQQADSMVVPEPLRIRHQQRIMRLEVIIQNHEQTRLVVWDERA